MKKNPSRNKPVVNYSSVCLLLIDWSPTRVIPDEEIRKNKKERKEKEKKSAGTSPVLRSRNRREY